MQPDSGNRKLWIAVALLGMAGLIVSLVLTIIQRDLESFSAACRVAEGFDCAPALKSRYGKWFGINVSAFAFAFNAFVVLLALQSMTNSLRRERNTLIVLVLSAAGVVTVAWMVHISLHRLRAYCVYCLALHILIPLLFLTALRLFQKRSAPVKETLRGEFATFRENRLALVGLLLIAIISGYGLLNYEYLAHERVLDEHPAYRSMLDGDAPRFAELEGLIKGRPYTGREDAPVTIVEFADFTCPICGQSDEIFRELSEVYNIKRVFIPHPRSRDCNPIATKIRPSACFSALAAKYSERNNRFWVVHDILFSDPDILSAQEHDRIAQLAGAENAAAIHADSQAQRALAEDMALAQALRIELTPTIFVNGMGIEGLPDPWFLEELIERELARGRPSAPESK